MTPKELRRLDAEGIVMLAVKRIGSRLKPFPKASETARDIVRRAAAVGDDEAKLLLASGVLEKAACLRPADNGKLTPARCRDARSLVGLSLADLATAAIVAPTIICDFEASGMMPSEGILQAMQRALERAGVEFIEGGVRLRKGNG